MHVQHSSLYTLFLSLFHLPAFLVLHSLLSACSQLRHTELCVCMHVFFSPLHSLLFSSASFFLSYRLLPLSSYLWMNECAIQCSARVASMLLCPCMCADCARVCLYSCLNLTAAPVWVTDPVVSWLQCFYCLATQLIFMLLLFSFSVCMHETKSTCMYSSCLFHFYFPLFKTQPHLLTQIPPFYQENITYIRFFNLTFLLPVFCILDRKKYFIHNTKKYIFAISKHEKIKKLSRN